MSADDEPIPDPRVYQIFLPLEISRTKKSGPKGSPVTWIWVCFAVVAVDWIRMAIALDREEARERVPS